MKPKLLILLLLLLLVALLALTTGPAGFGIPDLTHPSGSALFELRLARLLTALVAGVGLAISGTALQAVLHNPLAEPYVLGLSSGGSLGAALVVTLGWSTLSPLLLPLGAFTGALLTLLFVLLLATRTANLHPDTLILTGVVTASILSSLLMLLLTFASASSIHTITWWMLGSLQGTSWHLLATTATLILTALLILIFENRSLNALSLGSDTAFNLGINTRSTLPLILLAATLAAAASVALAGIIGFVGLIIPHLMRRLTSPNHRTLIPLTALGGAIFLAACDTIARTIYPPYELPVGVISALLGGPFFFYLLLQRNHPPTTI